MAFSAAIDHNLYSDSRQTFKKLKQTKYLILTKFREYLISRKIKRHISRVLNFAILKGN